MDEIANDLIRTFGEDVVQSRDVYPHHAGSIEVQYDPYNRRLKFFDMTPQDVAVSPQIASCVMADTATPLYSKLIVYARPGQQGWEALGFRHEADIWGFFGNGENAKLWVKYPATPRSRDDDEAKNEQVLQIAKAKECNEPTLPEGFTCDPAKVDDAPEIADLMRKTFPDYPTPTTPEYVADNMRQRVFHIRVIRNGDRGMVASASAEMHHTRKSAELTDCATLPEHRGKGLMSAILRCLEQDLVDKFGITDVYTIARANQTGMNCSFAKLGYTYTGRLVNNCRMPEGYESMNVWCRDASDLRGTA